MSLLSASFRRVAAFILRFWLPHWKSMAVAAFLTLLSAGLWLLLHGLVKGVFTFEHDAETTKRHWLMSLLPPFISESPFLYLGYCVFLSVMIIFYHVVSFFSYKKAQEAGQRIHNTIVTTVLLSILETPHLDRISLVNPVTLSQFIISSANRSASLASTLITDIFLSFCMSIFLLSSLLYISASLTVTIGVLFVSSQFILQGMWKKKSNSSTDMALAESNLQALGANALYRGATIRLFHAESLISNGLQRRLQNLSKTREDVVIGIHRETGFSSSVYGLLSILVLGVTSHSRSRGELVMADIAMYFMLLFQFVNRLQKLQHESKQTLSLLESLQTLQHLISWYEVEPIVWQKLESLCPRTSVQKASCPALMEERSLEKVPAGSDDSEAPIQMENVSYAYPEIPSFLHDALEKRVEQDVSDTKEGDTSPINPHHMDSKQKNGIRGVSCIIHSGKITALYGPSGSGKSTCLRILAGVLQPQSGTVRTHAKVALLEQQQAVLLGTVADNILMEDTSHLSGMDANRARSQVKLATCQSGCDTFLNDPFQEYIHSPDKTRFSGGQLQRICMARLFARRECSLLLLDEPTTGLDTENVQHLLSTLAELNATHNKTIVVATHDPRLASIAHHVIHLHDD